MMGRLVFALAAVSMLAPVNPAHLDWLRRDVPLASPSPGDPRSVATWQIYATPVKKGDRKGPYRFVGDEDEGVGCVDDVARAAVLYAREFEASQDAGAARQARAALDSTLAMRAGGGTYYNFIWADGTLNRTGPTSAPGLNWWTARALWALAEGARAFRASDPAYAKLLRERAFETVAALEADVVAHAKRGRLRDRHYAPILTGPLMGEAPDVTAVAMLGLAALNATQDDPRLKALLKTYGHSLASWSPAGPGSDLYGAHLPSLGPTHWHAYGAHMLHALTVAGMRTGDAALTAAARREADHFVPHLLISGGPIAGFFPAPVPYPQIAYGVEPQVLGLLALAEATGEPRYAKLAALFGAWLTGANPARTPMYDPATGRVFDGIDAKGPNADAGAESTIEGLLAWQALRRHPELASLVHARETARRGVSFLEAEKARGAQRSAVPGFSGEAGARLRPGQSLTLLLDRPDLSQMLTPVVRRERFEPQPAALALRLGKATMRRPVAWPPQHAPWPSPESLPGTRFRPDVEGRLTLTYESTGRQPLDLDGVIAQPVVEWRVFSTATGPVVVVANRTGTARTAEVPGLSAPVTLQAHTSQLIDARKTTP